MKAVRRVRLKGEIVDWATRLRFSWMPEVAILKR